MIQDKNEFALKIKMHTGADLLVMVARGESVGSLKLRIQVLSEIDSFISVVSYSVPPVCILTNNA